MPKAMTKAQIASHIAKKFDLPKVLVVRILNELAELAYKEAKNSFTLPGLGKLVLVQRKARMGRNPRTGEVIPVPEKKVLRFRISKTAKDEILRLHGPGGGR